MKTIPIVVQNQDRNVRQHEYDQFGKDLLVTSMFVTIQGEGPFAGHPAVFLRLSGCNYGGKDVACSFCDTAFVFDKGQRYSPEQLLAALVALPGYHASQILVVTGGEPTLQHNLLALIVLAKGYFSRVQIETNGTQASFFVEAQERGVANMFSTVVSPKALTKAGRYAALSSDVMWWATCLKFVVSSDPASAHHTVPDWALVSAKPVYVSPMAVYLKPYQGEVSSIWDTDLINVPATRANYEYSAKYALDNNLLLSLQTHLFVSVA